MVLDLGKTLGGLGTIAWVRWDLVPRGNLGLGKSGMGEGGVLITLPCIVRGWEAGRGEIRGGLVATAHR